MIADLRKEKRNNNPTRFRLTFGALAAGAAVVLAGCSSGSDDVANSPAGAPDVTETPAADVPVSELILSPDQLPGDYVVHEIPEEDQRETAAELDGLVRGAAVEPAACMRPEILPEDVADVDFDMILGIDEATGGSVAEIVAVGERDLEAFEQSSTGECEEFTVVVTEAGAVGEATAVNTVLDLPDVPADETYGIEQVVTADVDGTEIEVTMLVGWANVNGYYVTVTSTSMQEPDAEIFDNVFRDAVDKVADNT